MRLDYLEIEQFRGIRELKLEQLGDVNLLLGDNDSGKTSVLEAVRMFEAPDNINMIIRNARERLLISKLYIWESYTLLECLCNLFPFSQESKRLSLRAGIDGIDQTLAISGELFHILRPVSAEELRGYLYSEKSKNVELIEREVLTFQGNIDYRGKTIPISIDEYYSRPSLTKPFQTIKYMAPGDHLTGRNNASIYRTSKKQELEIVKLLKLIDPDIEGFKLVENEMPGGRNQVIEHKRFGNIPLYSYGDGMKKILALASYVLSAKGGVLLIDEIETSLQASHLKRVFAWLLRACRQFEVQLFVTTHSLEAVSALAGCAVEDRECDLVCYRLEADGGKTFGNRFSEEELDSMVNGRGFDVR
jgi:energy-coupling factor transporter ATP-binding protein EcfA2